MKVSIDSASTVTLGGRHVLVDPADLSVDGTGRWVVTDRGDKVVKVVSADGEVTTYGRPGKGPSEFQALVSGGPWDGGVFGYDLIARSVRVFDRDGRLSHNVQLGDRSLTPFAKVRVVDDSVLLATGWIPRNGDPAVLLYDRAGKQVGSAFNAHDITGDLDNRALMAMGVLADAHAGLIFATVFGYDTLMVFDWRGRLLASMTLRISSDTLPILRLPERVAANRGQMRRPDGTWVQEHAIGPRSVVALDSGIALVQFAPVDFSRKHDIVSEGGPTLVVQYHAGNVRVVRELFVQGALLGRDNTARAGLALRWRGKNLSVVDLFRIPVSVVDAKMTAQ